MLVFQNRYDGKSEVECRKQVAKDDLKKLFYREKNKITNMKQTFIVLENCNVPLY